MHEVRVDVEAVGNVSSNAIIRKLFRVRYCLAHLTQTWSFFVFRNFVSTGLGIIDGSVQSCTELMSV
jgi:hypothetical protein